MSLIPVLCDTMVQDQGSSGVEMVVIVCISKLYQADIRAACIMHICSYTAVYTQTNKILCHVVPFQMPAFSDTLRRRS